MRMAAPAPPPASPRRGALRSVAMPGRTARFPDTRRRPRSAARAQAEETHGGHWQGSRARVKGRGSCPARGSVPSQPACCVRPPTSRPARSRAPTHAYPRCSKPGPPGNAALAGFRGLAGVRSGSTANMGHLPPPVVDSRALASSPIFSGTLASGPGRRRLRLRLRIRLRCASSPGPPRPSVPKTRPFHLGELPARAPSRRTAPAPFLSLTHAVVSSLPFHQHSSRVSYAPSGLKRSHPFGSLAGLRASTRRRSCRP